MKITHTRLTTSDFAMFVARGEAATADGWLVDAAASWKDFDYMLVVLYHPDGRDDYLAIVWYKP